MRRVVTGILTCAALTVATAGLPQLLAATPPQAASRNLLEYIPADTPYVFTNLEPMPAALLEKMKGSTESIWEIYREVLHTAVEEEAKKAQEKGEEPDPASKELEEFFSDHMSWEGMESLGIGFKGHFAVYGVSLLPVLRWELDDAGAFQAGIARIQERLGSSAPKGSLGGQEYWVFKVKDGGFYAAVVGNSLVASYVPQELEADLLPVVFGSEKPSPSLADSGRLQQIAREKGYLPYGVGYLDIRRSAEILLGESADEYSKLIETLSPVKPEIDEACKREALEMAQTWPMVHAGYTEMSTRNLGVRFVLQTSPSLSRQLQGLVSQVPGIGTPGDGIFSWGTSLNLSSLRDFAAGQAEYFRSNPYQCRQLAELSGIFEKIEKSLNEAPPPLFALGLRGFRTVIQSFDFDFQTKDLRDLKGYAVVHLDNPLLAVQMMQTAGPELADLNLQPDGEPVPLPDGLVPPSMPTPVLVMTQDAIGASFGEESLPSLQAALTAETLQPTPLLSLGYRLSEMTQLIRQIMEAEAAESNDPDKVAEAQRAIKLVGLYEYMKNFTLNFSFTDEGVVISESIELK